MKITRIAVDIGMTNIDLVMETETGLTRQMLANQRSEAPDQVRQALETAGEDLPEAVPGGSDRRTVPDAARCSGWTPAVQGG